jgi:hypothetical protein
VAFYPDPLGALLVDLERAVPSDASQDDASDWQDDFVIMQKFVQFISSHEDMPAPDREQLLEQQSWYQRFIAWSDRVALVCRLGRVDG